jgi:hypothetical protein
MQPKSLTNGRCVLGDGLLAELERHRARQLHAVRQEHREVQARMPNRNGMTTGKHCHVAGQ